MKNNIGTFGTLKTNPLDYKSLGFSKLIQGKS
jgi:hypothetical protein